MFDITPQLEMRQPTYLPTACTYIWNTVWLGRTMAVNFST